MVDYRRNSRIWKRAATNYRGRHIHAEQLVSHYHGWWLEAEATTEQRLKSLNVWKQAAKKWRMKFFELHDDCEVIDSTADYWKHTADRRKELLREGLEATKRADGHWSDRGRWMNWVEKVEKELADD